MLVDRKFQIWLSVASDDMRPSLQHVDIINAEQAGISGLHIPGGYNGLMLATDGFQLVIIPVELDEDDIPGLLLPAVLKDAGKATPKTIHDGKAFVGLDSLGMVKLFDGTSRLRVSEAGLNFPDVSTVVPNKRPACVGVRKDSFINFDLKIVMAAGKAIGLDFRKYGVSNITVSFNGSNTDPYIVEYAGSNKNNVLVAPFALIMPVYHGR